MQDMESHVLDVENMLQEEIAETAQSNVVINQLNGELLAAHHVVGILEGTVTNLETQLAQKDTLIAAKDAQIAALQAQLNPTHQMKIKVKQMLHRRIKKKMRMRKKILRN
jgi:hypothetical protein